MRLFQLPPSTPLAEYDPALATRLLVLLTHILRDELGRPESQAMELAETVLWTVSRERDGMWLYLTYEGGPVIGAGGDPPHDEDGLTLYVRQIAYHLVGREEDFEP